MPRDDLVFFLDENLDRCSAILDALARLSVRCERHGQHFKPGVPDADWLPVVGDKGWILITSDQNLGNYLLDAQGESAHTEAEARGLAPWEVNPYGLISWLDMLQFSARQFFWTGRALRSICHDCIIGSHIETSPSFAPGRELDDAARELASESLKKVADQFRKIGLDISADTAKEIVGELEKASTPQSFQWLIDHVHSLERLADKELKNKVFFYIPNERAKFFPRVDDLHIFGKPVADAFPSASYDIFESGMCLALSRGTGCVFHLMRTLEIGLTVLGAKFGVSLAHTNWAPAIEQIESRIRELHKDEVWKALPDYKEQQELYAQAASHFGILKDAWRNYTAHARGKYTLDEAESIFYGVKGFMQKLANLLQE